MHSKSKQSQLFSTNSTKSQKNLKIYREPASNALNQQQNPVLNKQANKQKNRQLFFTKVSKLKKTTKLDQDNLNITKKRLRLQDYLLLTHNSSKLTERKQQNLDKKELRKQKYKIDRKKIITLINQEISQHFTVLNEKVNKIQQKLNKRPQIQDGTLRTKSKQSIKYNESLQISIKSKVKDIIKQKIMESLNQIQKIIQVEWEQGKV